MVNGISDSSGGKVFFGRKRPGPRGPRFKLKNYLLRAFPSPPDRCDYTLLASSALSQVYMNNTLGDCVIAMMAHVEDVWQGNSGGVPNIFTNGQIEAEYASIGGYVVGDDSTDNGCDEVTALNSWQRYGFSGLPPIQAWVQVDGSDSLEYRTAIYLFENILFGMELPDAWVQSMPQGSGFTWDAAGAPNPNNGHAFPACKYDAFNGCVYNETWGLQGILTDRAIAQYTTAQSQGAVYTALSPEILVRAQQRAPNGFNWTQLLSDIESMT